jgi:hypothetical protein
MKILLGDFDAKVNREDIFKNTIGNESLHEISNDNGVRVVNFTVSKNLFVKNTMFPHRNIQKLTWTSPDGKTHNQIGHTLIDRKRQLSVLDIRSFMGENSDVSSGSEKTAQKFRMEKFSLKKLNEAEAKEGYRVEM